MNEFLIKLQAELDEVRSKENINKDITRIQSQLDNLKIKAELDPKVIQTLADEIGKLANKKIIISNIGIDNTQITKEAINAGKQSGDAFVNGIEYSSKKVNKLLRPFSELKIGTKNIGVVLDEQGLIDTEKSLKKIKDLYSEFGQVTIKNKTFDIDGDIQSFKVHIEQVNGELKEFREFAMALNGTSFSFPEDIIKGSESIVQHLDKSKNIINETADAINELKIQSRVSDISKLMDNGQGVSKYQNQIDKYTNDFKKYGYSVEEAKNQTKSLQDTFDNMKGMSGQQLIDQADKLEQEFKDVKVSVEAAKLSYDKFAQPASDEKISGLILRIQKFIQSNSKITDEARIKLQRFIQELNNTNVTEGRWKAINAEFKKTESAMSILNKLGKSFSEQFKEVGRNVTSYMSVSSIFSSMFSQTKDSVVKLKEINSILTEISKTSDLTEQQLKTMGNTAFKAASKYGKFADDYLIGIQEMYRAGYKNAEQMSELSILAQSAGDMDSSTANDYLIASDAAYGLKGNVEELNKVLDGQNFITNNAAVSMLDMAEATSEAASIASQYGVQVDELSALIAMATSKTRESGNETGNALKSLFVNLQDTTSKPIREAFEAVNISMTEIINGAEKLKTPIQLLKELSEAFVSLDEGDTKRANILSDIGGKYHANTLSAILSDWGSYEKMLNLYSQGMGSAAAEAEKSANNWEGSMARLSNTWTSTINNIADSDAIISGINGLNSFLSVIDKITSALGSLGTIVVGTGIFASLKNVGRDKMYSLIFVVLNSRL